MSQLIPHYGPHATDLVLARRPLAYPGVYAGPAAAPPRPAPPPPLNLCDWFDLETEQRWRAGAGVLDWASPATGGWHDAQAAEDWKADAAGGGWRRRKPCA